MPVSGFARDVISQSANPRPSSVGEVPIRRGHEVSTGVEGWFLRNTNTLIGISVGVATLGTMGAAGAMMLGAGAGGGVAAATASTGVRAGLANVVARIGGGIGAIGGALKDRASALFGRLSMWGGSASPTPSQPSVWSLGPGVRGRVIEARLGGNLPSNFPTIDRFSEGTATSIKSVDLSRPTYQTARGLESLLNRYIGSMATYEGQQRRWAGIIIRPAQIQVRELQLAIPPTFTPGQAAVLREAVEWAETLGVQLTITPIE